MTRREADRPRRQSGPLEIGAIRRAGHSPDRAGTPGQVARPRHREGERRHTPVALRLADLIGHDRQLRRHQPSGRAKHEGLAEPVPDRRRRQIEAEGHVQTRHRGHRPKVEHLIVEVALRRPHRIECLVHQRGPADGDAEVQCLEPAAKHLIVQQTRDEMPGEQGGVDGERDFRVIGMRRAAIAEERALHALGEHLRERIPGAKHRVHVRVGRQQPRDRALIGQIRRGGVGVLLVPNEPEQIHRPGPAERLRGAADIRMRQSHDTCGLAATMRRRRRLRLARRTARGRLRERRLPIRRFRPRQRRRGALDQTAPARRDREGRRGIRRQRTGRNRRRRGRTGAAIRGAGITRPATRAGGRRRNDMRAGQRDRRVTRAARGGRGRTKRARPANRDRTPDRVRGPDAAKRQAGCRGARGTARKGAVTTRPAGRPLIQAQQIGRGAGDTVDQRAIGPGPAGRAAVASPAGPTGLIGLRIGRARPRRRRRGVRSARATARATGGSGTKSASAGPARRPGTDRRILAANGGSPARGRGGGRAARAAAIGPRGITRRAAKAAGRIGRGVDRVRAGQRDRRRRRPTGGRALAAPPRAARGTDVGRQIGRHGIGGGQRRRRRTRRAALTATAAAVPAGPAKRLLQKAQIPRGATRHRICQRGRCARAAIGAIVTVTAPSARLVRPDISILTHRHRGRIAGRATGAAGVTRAERPATLATRAGSIARRAPTRRRGFRRRGESANNRSAHAAIAAPRPSAAAGPAGHACHRRRVLGARGLTDSGGGARRRVTRGTVGDGTIISVATRAAGAVRGGAHAMHARQVDRGAGDTTQRAAGRASPARPALGLAVTHQIAGSRVVRGQTGVGIAARAARAADAIAAIPARRVLAQIQPCRGRTRHRVGQGARRAGAARRAIIAASAATAGLIRGHIDGPQTGRGPRRRRRARDTARAARMARANARAAGAAPGGRERRNRLRARPGPNGRRRCRRIAPGDAIAGTGIPRAASATGRIRGRIDGLGSCQSDSRRGLPARRRVGTARPAVATIGIGAAD